MNFLETKDLKSGKELKLFYTDNGTGLPVVLIHGWPLSHEMWEYQTGELVSKGLRVITYDRRGFGKSSRPWDGYDYDSLTEDLKAVVDHLNLSNATLVGFSMGGGEAVRYLAKYGNERVSRLVLLGSVTPYLLKTSDNPDGVDKEIFEGIAENIKKDRIAFLDVFGKQFYGVNLINHPVSTPFLEWNRALASMACPHATLECAKSFSETDFRDDLKKINLPTLIIHGSSDKTVPIEASSDRTARDISNSTYLIYDGAPHGFFYTEREKLNSDLYEFVTNHGSPIYSSNPVFYQSII